MKTVPVDNAFPILTDSNRMEWGLTKKEYMATVILQGLITGVRASGDSLNIKELTESAIMITEDFINKLNTL
jgi:hypothetical protein